MGLIRFRDFLSGDVISYLGFTGFDRVQGLRIIQAEQDAQSFGIPCNLTVPEFLCAALRQCERAREKALKRSGATFLMPWQAKTT